MAGPGRIADPAMRLNLRQVSTGFAKLTTVVCAGSYESDAAITGTTNSADYDGKEEFLLSEEMRHCVCNFEWRRRKVGQKKFASVAVFLF